MSYAARRRVPGRMTVEEFLLWADDRSPQKWQLVDGEPVAMSPAAAVHGVVQAQLAFQLVQHLRSRNSPCRVITEPAVRPRIRANINMRVPDLAVTCAPIALGEVAVPEPILIVEILSPSNEPDTWDNIWTYASIPSLRDILVVHSTKILVELLSRQADGAWPEEPTRFGQGDTVDVPGIGFSCPVAEFYRGTPYAPAD